MLAPPRAPLFGLLTLALACLGAGVPFERAGEGCRCEEAEALDPSAAGGAEAAGEDGAAGAPETCPPDCDDCSCCGGAPMLASFSRSAAELLPGRALEPPRSMERDAPRGEPSGVFRPPRA
jgi:hypothetical protein